MFTFLSLFWYTYDDWFAGLIGVPLMGELPLVLWIVSVVFAVFLDSRVISPLIRMLRRST